MKALYLRFTPNSYVFAQPPTPKGEGPFGHHDMTGLVWEWCRDTWEPDLSRWAKGEPLDPVGDGDPDFRPFRGGSWELDATYLRSAFRSRGRPRDGYDNVGFRVLCAALTPLSRDEKVSSG